MSEGHTEDRPRGARPQSTSAAAEQVGLTPEQFRRLAQRLGIQPEDWYPNPHYRSGPPCPLWPAERVQALVGGPEAAAVKARAQKRKEGLERKARERQEALKDLATTAGPGEPDQHKTRERWKALQDRYPNWRDALQPAAEALFSLNRYAKWGSCRPNHRKEIYRLKTRLVELLYRLGLAREVKIHVVERAGRTCRACRGSGGHWSGEDCERCDGTGWYLPPDKVHYVAFRFDVGGQMYAWHQPRELVTWRIQTTASAGSWKPEATEKPIKLSPQQLAHAKALIRYCLAQATAEGAPSSTREQNGGEA